MGDVYFGVLLAILALLIIATNAVVTVALVRLIWKTGCLGLCFVLNLAIADSLVGFTITGLVTEELAGHAHHTTRTYCILRMSCIVCPSAASILTVILVAFDRYLAIKHPFRYFKIMHGLVVRACIGGLWLLAFLIGFLPLIVQSFQKKDYQEPCTFFGVFLPTYMLTVFCVAFIPALFAFTYIHCHLLKIASSHAQQIREQEQIHSSGTYAASQPFSDTKGLMRRVYAYWQKEVRFQLYQMCLCMKSKVFPLFHVDSCHHAPSGTVASVHTISLPKLEE
uniref:Uncharacterized protein n=1 Tax=Sphaerodactylus townsendi TaxID=933632 RepID=A0ACB8FXL8_9SAUR